MAPVCKSARVYCPLPSEATLDSEYEGAGRALVPFVNVEVTIASCDLERGSNAPVLLQIVNTTGQQVVVKEVLLVGCRGPQTAKVEVLKQLRRRVLDQPAMDWIAGSFKKQEFQLKETIAIPDWISPSNGKESDPTNSEAEDDLDDLDTSVNTDLEEDQAPVALALSPQFKEAFLRKSLYTLPHIEPTDALPRFPSPSPSTFSTDTFISTPQLSDSSVFSISINDPPASEFSDEITTETAAEAITLVERRKSAPPLRMMMGTESHVLVRKRPLSFFPGSLPYTKSSQASPTRNLMNAFLPRILQKKRSSFLTVKMKPSTAQLNNHTTLLPAISSTSIPEITEVQEPPPVPPKETSSVPFKISEVIAAKEPMMLRKMVQLDDGLVSVVSIGGQVDDNLDDDESGPLSAHQPPMSPPSDTVDHDNSSQVPAPYLKQQQDKSIQEVQPEPAPQASNLERFLKSKPSSSPTKRHSLAPTDIQRSSSASSIEQPTNKSRHSYIPSSLVPRSLSLTPNNRSLSRLSTISSTSTMSNRSSVISLSGPSEFGKAWWLAQPSEEDVTYSIVVRVGLKRSFRKGGARVNLTVEVPVTVV